MNVLVVTIISFLIPILGFVNFYINSKYETIEKDKQDLRIKKSTAWGKAVLIISAAIIVLGTVQKLLQDNLTKETSLRNEKNIHIRDSIRDAQHLEDLQELEKKHHEDSVRTDAILAKHGYKLDSARQKLTVINTYKENARPILMIPTMPGAGGIFISEINSDNFVTLNIHIQSLEAPSTHFKLKCDLLSGLDNMVVTPGTKPIDTRLDYETILPTGHSFAFSRKIYIPKHIKKLFIWLRGDYQGLYSSVNLSINDVYSFDVTSGNTEVLAGEMKQHIINGAKGKY